MTTTLTPEQRALLLNCAYCGLEHDKPNSETECRQALKTALATERERAQRAEAEIERWRGMLRNAVQERDTLRRQLAEPPTCFRCPTCGTGVKADEDGCCAMCGADCAVVEMRDEIVRLQGERDAHRALATEHAMRLAAENGKAHAETERDTLCAHVEQLKEYNWHVAQERDSLRAQLDTALRILGDWIECDGPADKVWDEAAAFVSDHSDAAIFAREAQREKDFLAYVDRTIGANIRRHDATWQENQRLRAQLADRDRQVAALREALRRVQLQPDCWCSPDEDDCLEQPSCLAAQDILAQTARAADAYEARIRQEERERCAQVAERFIPGADFQRGLLSDVGRAQACTAKEIASGIRDLAALQPERPPSKED